MTEQTLEHAVELKRLIDGHRKNRKELKTLKEICLGCAEEEEKKVYMILKGLGEAVISLDTIIHALDTEIKKVTEEIESLVGELDQLH